ncbi:MAG TPA: ABC transporter permease [Longimicrobium sp.]|jgi:ABC-type multidrug transport system permease subunit|uniref:ABC transporter permease n=1 Tax=Longimicrobium sp. TaxID=2029185 RepID=UPI002ED9DD26
MHGPSPLRELTLARIRSFLREPEALFWTFGFPIIMAIGLGLAFRERPAERVAVGVERGSVAERYAPALAHSDEVELTILPPDSTDHAIRKGDIAVLLAGRDALTYRYDPARAESRSAQLVADRVVQRAAGVTERVPSIHDRERRPGGRYIDWVLPGLIGMNLMSTGMWGMGFGLVQMRQKKQLKRLSSTPMRRRDFLLAQILARLSFLSFEVPPVVLFAWLAFGVTVQGSLLGLALVTLVGAMTFAGLGLLASARAKTIEGLSGALNLVMFPMFVLSGVFFPASRYPDAIQPFVQALPLTALNDALRAVYNDALPFAAYAGELAILAAWMAVTFLLSVRWFRWQ